eukprot:TRINITY_DN2751_c0_g1_i1.p1 TRINITY_DN2751_c0_g1~~TRINITY_DN2751_c0_g1_i1.p1  ORF type:complete len:275 (-),score=36.89 TRINITY_DN2751_c0_g1_i1:40-864(-)
MGAGNSQASIKTEGNEGNTEVLPLFALPRDVIGYILLFLPLKDLLRTTTLSKSMKELTDSDHIWRNLLVQESSRRDLPMMTKPTHDTWKETFKSKIYFSTFIECGIYINIKNNVASVGDRGVLGSIAEMAFTRFHYSGKHKYVIRIDNNNYVGIGVGSRELPVLGEAKLHSTPSCSVYYYTGYWYGKRRNREYEIQTAFNKGDHIHLYFDVDTREIRYYNQSKLLGNCTLQETENRTEKGLRLAIVLGSTNSSVSIIDYQSVDTLPSLDTEKVI